MMPYREETGRLFSDLAEQPVVMISVDSLVGSDSPRFSGEDAEHVRELAQLEDPLPPIIVHRPTMRVIDGMHRLWAARLRGRKEIAAWFFDGDSDSAFVLAVRSNVVHGLPLSLGERKAAASRIIASHPQWSDRMIASVAGLASKTVAALRPTGDKQQLAARVGRDGRARPLDAGRGREAAARFIADHPGASLRQIAREAGVSRGTAADVRDRLRRGLSAVPEPGAGAGIDRVPLDEQARDGGRARWQDSRKEAAPGCSEQGLMEALSRGERALRALAGDPAFRSTDTGRALLRMLSACQVIRQQGRRLVDGVPEHCRGRVADAACACASAWKIVAELAEKPDSA
jgi:hypothetical protein